MRAMSYSYILIVFTYLYSSFSNRNMKMFENTSKRRMTIFDLLCVGNNLFMVRFVIFDYGL